NNKILGVKNIKGNIQVDMARAKSLKERGKQGFGEANQKINQFAGANVSGQGAQGAQMQQQGGGMPGGGMPGGMPGGAPQQGGMPGAAPGMPGAMPGAPGAAPGGPGIRMKGFWLWKKKYCMQCEQQLYKTWDACPYCAQIQQQVAAAPAKLAGVKAKTQAFMM